jgi:hypothetical protein
MILVGLLIKGDEHFPYLMFHSLSRTHFVAQEKWKL